MQQKVVKCLSYRCLNLAKYTDFFTLNSVDSQTKQDIFAGKYTEKCLVKLRIELIIITGSLPLFAPMLTTLKKGSKYASEYIQFDNFKGK